MTQLLRTQLDTDLESLIDTLPPHIRELLLEREDVNELLEVVLDLGREPEARFLSERPRDFERRDYAVGH